MSLTYQICEVTVTLPSLGTITTDGPGNQIKHGDKCRVDLYAVKPDWRAGSTFQGFIVGWLTFEGYCETPYNRSQKIMMPDGYKLVALMVDENGMPTSWDSLAVQFSGGPIGTPIDALDGIADALDTALARYHGQYDVSEPEKTSVLFLAERWVALEGKYTAEEIRDAVEHIKRTRMAKALGKSLAELSPFAMKNGQVFINDACIGNGITSESGRIYASGMGVSVDNGKEQVEFEAEKFEIAASSKDPLDSALQEAIKKIVNEALQKATQPGGLLYGKR